MRNFQFSKYMKNFQFSKYCTPAQLYLALGTIGIIGAFFTDYGMKTLLTKALFLVVWAWVLNWLCSKGFKAISWILVLLPFVFFLFMYFLAKDVVREGLGMDGPNEGQIRAQVTAEMMAGGPTCENPKGGEAPPTPDDEHRGSKSGKTGTGPQTKSAADGKTAPAPAPAPKPGKEGLCETEQQKKARLQPLINAEVAKRVAAEQAKIDARIKAQQASAAAAAEKKKKDDEAAAKAARNAGGNAGSANDTRTYDENRAIALGSELVGGINPIAGAAYDYASEFW